MARRLLECGAQVAICSAPNEDVEKPMNQLKALSSDYQVLGFKPNLTNLSEMTAVAQKIEREWGRILIRAPWLKLMERWRTSAIQHRNLQ